MTYLPHHVVLKDGREDVVCACGEHFRSYVTTGRRPVVKDAIQQWVAHYNAEQAADETRGGDGPCEDCGLRYPPWSAPNEVWNLVMGGPDATDDPGGLLCPTCFAVRAERAGQQRIWRIVVVRPPHQSPRVIV